VGRSEDLDRIRRLLGEHRLVTLTGVGGIGKTRLAIRVAEEAVPALAGRVGWIDLAPLDDPRLIPSTMCAELNLSVGARTRPREALVGRLRDGRWLVVLDNCEHLVDACAELCAELIDICPDLRILATSRESLRVSGEVTSRVSSLPVPDDPFDEGALDRIREAGSVRLFLERARAARPDFELTSENLGSVVRLCHRLDGIPLALELAAARVRMLAVEQIVERLDEEASVLRREEREAPTRHRTMQAALRWSHGLLTEPERVLFRRLGVFAGAFSLEACESVCANGGLERPAILDRLSRLVDKSMVLVEEGEAAARYRLLEPVRRFAAERLEASEELDEVRRRHVDFFRDLAEGFAPELRTSGRSEATRRLEAVHDDLRRAWDHAAETRDEDTLARLTRALFWFWNFGGHFGEGRRRSEEGLDRVAAGSAARADLLWAAGALAWMQGDYEVAGSRLEACRETCRREGDGVLLGLSLRELGGVHLTLGELPAAARLLEDGCDELRAAERTWDLALARVMLADVRDGLGDLDAARELRQEARALFAEVEDPWGLSLAHFGLGLAAAREEDLDAARVHVREALGLQRDAGDDWNIGQVSTLLGEIEARDGQEQRAAGLLVEGLSAFRRVGDRMSAVHALRCLAAVEARRGRTLRAVRLAGAADALAEPLEGSYPYALTTESEHAGTVRELREAAGEEAFAEAWASGRRMDLDEAIALASEVHGSSRRRLPSVLSDEVTARVVFLGLGPPRVHVGRRRLRASDWTYALPRELAFYLLVHGPRTREQIGLAFWPEASSEQLRGRLRTALYHLRRALGGTEWVRYENGRYDVDRSLDYWFDVEAFEGAVDDGLGQMESDPPTAAVRLNEAVDLYRGEFLEGESTRRWASSDRTRLRRRFVQAVVALGELWAAREDHAAAVELYRRALDVNRLHEGLHRRLARSLARAGDRAAALRQLDELDELYRRELDADPSEATVELRDRLERGLEP
jgi:predicted ATPase/DNA-binding SARP family transcriptional activator